MSALPAEAAPSIVVEPEELADNFVPVVVDPKWQDRANCKGNPADFYVEGHRGRPRTDGRIEMTAQQELVTEYCITCAVQSDCLATALLRLDGWGVQGGTDEPTREPLIESMKQGHGTMSRQEWESALEYGFTVIERLESLPPEQIAPRTLLKIQARKQAATQPVTPAKSPANTPAGSQASTKECEEPVRIDDLFTLRARMHGQITLLKTLRSLPAHDANAQRKEILAVIAGIQAEINTVAI